MKEPSIAAQKRAYAILHKAAMRQIDSGAKAEAAALTAQHKARQNVKVHKVTRKKG